MDFSEFKVSATASEDGIWVEHDETTKFLDARMGNKKFLTMFNKISAPYRRQMDANKLAVEKQTELMCRCMAKHVLLGWEGLTNNGKEIPYSETTALELLTTEGADEFRDLIASYASDNEAFRTQEMEGQAKN